MNSWSEFKYTALPLVLLGCYISAALAKKNPIHLVNVHKLAVLSDQNPGSGHLATNTKLLYEIKISLAVALGNVAQQTPTFANHLQ